MAAAFLVIAGFLAACSGGGRSGVTAPSSAAPERSTTTVFTFGDVGSKGKLPALGHENPTPVAGLEGTVTEIATSNSDSYALTSAGSVFAWGAGTRGELGDGSRSDSRRALKVDFPPGVRIDSLPNPMPFDGALAIDSDGDVWGWGVNSANELCLPGTASVLRPTRLPLTDVTLATGAARHNLFDSHGRVYACGQGQSGQLGNGTFGRAPTPTLVVGLPAGGVKTLVSSWQGSGALMSDGSYFNWGYNAAGQLGDSTVVNSDRPVRVNLPASVSSVFQGGSTATNGQTLALLTTGQLWAWGSGSYGQLGTGSTANSAVPVQVPMPSGVQFVQINSGGYASYAIDGTGKLWAWGSNSVGQLGTSTSSTMQLTPVAVGLAVAQVSSTADNVAALAHN